MKLKVSRWSKPLHLLSLIFYLLEAEADLVIQACCGNPNLCQPYTRAEDLFGIACCGQQPYNAYSEICCNGVVRDRRNNGRYAEMCCGTDVLGYEQTCCNGVIHNVANGDCCGMAVYSKSDPTLKCCNQTLARASSSSDVCCGSFTYDGGRSQICCGDKVFEKSDYDNCCENPNDATFKEFNSATHYCCGTPQLRNSPTKCCYMRPQGQEKSVPVPYNSNQQCCKYPFITFTQRPANGQCVD